jgi:hypothetical protein
MVTIMNDRFRTAAKILSISEVLLPLLQLLNAKVISLPMHCFTAILTSLISQALLQVVLDKRRKRFHQLDASV